MLQLAGHDDVAGAGEHAQRDLVGHDARRDEHGRGLPDPLGVGGLELVHGRILAVAVVADFGLGHRAPHRAGRPRDRVTAKVHDARHASTLQRTVLDPIRGTGPA